MKKTLIVLVGVLLTVGLWGCGESTPAENTNSTIGNLTKDANSAASKAITDANKVATDAKKTAEQK